MQEIETIIDRLLHFEPIQYIFGHTLWNGLDLKVTPSTLIPRPETAELVKKAHPEWSVTGIDISPEAIEVARENARRNNVDVHFEVADIFSDQMTKYLNKWYMVNDPYGKADRMNEVNKEMVNDQMVNIVVSNPPYICESEKVSMKSNVLDYEPSTALFVPDSDPLLFYRRIAELQTRRSPNSKQGEAQTPKPLFLFFEINEAYGPQLSAMLESIGYTNIQIHKDIYGKDRIIEARMAR